MPSRPDARRLELARLVDAGGDQHRVMARAQIGQRRIAPDLEIQAELDAAVVEPLRRGASTTCFSSLKLGMP